MQFNLTQLFTKNFLNQAKPMFTCKNTKKVGITWKVANIVKGATSNGTQARIKYKTLQKSSQASYWWTHEILQELQEQEIITISYEMSGHEKVLIIEQGAKGLSFLLSYYLTFCRGIKQDYKTIYKTQKEWKEHHRTHGTLKHISKKDLTEKELFELKCAEWFSIE